MLFSFVQQLFIEALKQVLDFHVMKPGIDLAFQELLIKVIVVIQMLGNFKRGLDRDFQEESWIASFTRSF